VRKEVAGLNFAFKFDRICFEIWSNLSDGRRASLAFAFC